MLLEPHGEMITIPFGNKNKIMRRRKEERSIGIKKE
jgi:hypothetical protein